MAPIAHLIETIDVGDTLGEGVLWREEDQSVWWTDIHGRRVHHLLWPSLHLTTYPAPERVCSLAFVQGRPDLLLVAFESGFALWSPVMGAIHWLARPAELRDGVRLNDGRVDPAGRFWVGSMRERSLRDGETPPGCLYRLDADGHADVMRRGLHISNGLSWSPDATRIYVADSVPGEVLAAPFDARSGSLGDAHVIARFVGESPDGATTDTAGNYWAACWGGGRVARLSPDGAETGSLPVDAEQPTCPVFGGSRGNLLFVTSARDGLDSARLAGQPRAGSLFIFETTSRGCPQAHAHISPLLLDQISAP